jgi:hypothetical protein
LARLANDPIINAVYGGIKRDIDVALDNRCLRAAIILIYSGIDTMARLAMDAAKTGVEKSDFIAWVDRYIHFPCKEQLTGLDLYAARCAVLHTYTTDSGLSRAGKARRIGYMDHAVPEVVYNASVDATLVLVSIKALRDSFFAGIDRFFVEAFADAAREAIVEKRLRELLHELPFAPPEPGEAAT